MWVLQRPGRRVLLPWDFGDRNNGRCHETWDNSEVEGERESFTMAANWPAHAHWTCPWKTPCSAALQVFIHSYFWLYMNAEKILCHVLEFESLVILRWVCVWALLCVFKGVTWEKIWTLKFILLNFPYVWAIWPAELVSRPCFWNSGCCTFQDLNALVFLKKNLTTPGAKCSLLCNKACFNQSEILLLVQISQNVKEKLVPKWEFSHYWFNLTSVEKPLKFEGWWNT